MLEYLAWLSGYKIDLKTMQDKHYPVGGVLQNVLTIQKRRARPLVEVVGWVCPVSTQPGGAMGSRPFIRSSRRYPWQVTGLHPDTNTTRGLLAAPLQQAAEIARSRLHYVLRPSARGLDAGTYCLNALRC